MPQLLMGAFGGGLAGFFGSRAFVPAFALSLCLRLGYGGAVAGALTGMSPGAVPAWFTSDACLIVLGVLAALEVASTKVAELREVFDAAGPYVKPAMAALTVLGVLSAADSSFVTGTVGERLTEASAAAMIPPAASGAFLAGLVAIGAWGVAVARSAALAPFAEADEDDAAGVQHALAWAEDLWALCGPVLLLLFPLVMLAVVAAVTGLLVRLRRRRQAAEDARRLPCVSCGEPVYACALACPACRTPVASPRSVGFLGTGTDRPIADPARHALELASKKRCPTCAARLAGRSVDPRCDACGRRPFADGSFADDYLGHVARRVPGVLVVCGALSLIPVVGLVAGVVYYRLALVAPFRRYLPRGRAFGTRLGLRVLFVLLAAFQVVPLLGGAVVPIMAMANYAAYRRAWLGARSREGRPDASPAVALA